MGWYELNEKINNDKEKPVDYGMVGTVTISAKEYRELVESLDFAIGCAKEENDRYYKKCNEASELNQRVKSLQASLEKAESQRNELRKFVSECELSDRLSSWRVDKMVESEVDEE